MDEWTFRRISNLSRSQTRGILSADLYKIYIEDLLDNFHHEESGCKFGNLTINAIACADAIALTSHTKEEMQIWLI